MEQQRGRASSAVEQMFDPHRAADEQRSAPSGRAPTAGRTSLGGHFWACPDPERRPSRLTAQKRPEAPQFGAFVVF